VQNKGESADFSSAEAREKEKIERTIGVIGGKARRKGKILNAVFVAAVCGAFVTSLLTTGIPQIMSVDVGVLLLSLKLAYHLHTEAKVNHAQFWILTTIEERLLDLIKELRGLRREFRDSSCSTKDKSASDATMKKGGSPRQEH